MTSKVVNQDLDTVFNALANEHRRSVVYALGLRPASISQLADMQDLSLPAMHKHVKILESSGLVRRQKVGRTNFLALNKKTLLVLQNWLNKYHAYWGNDKETLENYAASIAKYSVAPKQSIK